MSLSRTILVLLLSGAGLVGCKKDEKTSESPAPAPAVAPAVAPLASATAAKPVMVPPASQPLLPPAGGPITSITPEIPREGTANAAALKLLTDAQSDIANRRWEPAESIFKKLNAMKGELSPEMKKAVDKANDNFVTARNASRLPLTGPATVPSNPEPNK